ncbi:MAG: hypothetical protein M1827_000807 [Pycnora praestabilis]|nr:MAG: hypothetical protein M1827_000807 [Pycnora praestabilis]
MPSISPIAQTGFANASSYDEHRPSYPPEAVEKLLNHLLVAGIPEATIIDLAAGTGKFTELLAKRDEAFDILAIEPHEGMRKELERKNLKGVVTKDGDATHMPVQDESVDAVVAAQPLHDLQHSPVILVLTTNRFSNEESLREIHRVIHTGGVFAMIWNVEEYNQPKSWPTTTSWESKIKAITWSFDDAHPRFRHEKWRGVFEAQLKTTPLTIQTADPQFSLPLGEDSVKFTVWLSREAVWERYSTLSQIAVLEGEERERVRREVFEAMEGLDVETNEKGEVALHGVTFWAWTTRV